MKRRAAALYHDRLQPLHDRKRSFLKAIARLSGNVQSATAAGNDSPDGGLHAMRTLLESGPCPTAVICVNDFMALGVLKALRECGLRVPEDVSVAGFDNLRLSEFSSPPLTTVNVPRDTIGQAVYGAVFPQQGAPPILSRDVIIEPDLIVRESTGRASRGGQARAGKARRKRVESE